MCLSCTALWAAASLSRASLSSGEAASATRVWSATAIACLAELSSRVGGGGVVAQAASTSTLPKPNTIPDPLRRRRVISQIRVILSSPKRSSALLAVSCAANEDEVSPRNARRVCALAYPADHQADRKPEV